MLSSSKTVVNLTNVQLVRKAVLLSAIVAGVVFVVIGDSRWPSGSFVHEAIEWVGLVLIVLCIVGRTICTLYIGGKKVASLVDDGPYSITRNPLYALSIVGAAGVGAQLGSIVLAFAAGVVTWLVFLLVIFKEEQALTQKFGASYLNYLATVPRLFPTFALWRDVDKVEVRPRLVLVTALDACIFLVSIPIAELFEYLHEIAVLPTLVLLP